MYSYNKLIVLRLQISAENLILELSIRCVRKRGVETQMLARITRVKVRNSESEEALVLQAHPVLLVS